MKVFLSWSGELSYSVAGALHQWLPYILQPIQPFLSSDISKGDRWGEALEKEIKDAQYGIICVTPYNLNKPWMNFEAGALSRVIDRSYVTPFLFRVPPSCVTGPLAQFQSAVYSEADVLNLVYSMNNRLGTANVDREVLRRSFTVWWKELKKALDDITPSSQEETRTVYKWLYTFADVTIHEAKPDTRSIWIVTSDLVRHATGNDIRPNIIANIRNGIKYQYFLSEADGTDYTELNQLSANSSGKLAYRVFKKAVFDNAAVTDYIITNADVDASLNPLRMFLKLPIEEGDYWIRVDENSARKFTDRFRKLWDEQSQACG